MLVRHQRLLAAWFIAATAVAIIARAAAGAPTAAGFPYVAYVIEPDAYIRSGPGRQHYPTGQLPAGYAVEVYRHDEGGWCAIRPPEGSFSLVPAHQLRIIDQRTAEVVADGVVARVGSSLGAQQRRPSVAPARRSDATGRAAQTRRSLGARGAAVRRVSLDRRPPPVADPADRRRLAASRRRRRMASPIIGSRLLRRRGAKCA